MRTPVAIRVILLTGAVGPIAACAAAPASYVRKATWHESLIASREALVQAEAEAARKAAAQAAAAPKVGELSLGTWYSAGPFYPPGGKKDFKLAFPPEKEAGLNAPDADAEATKAALAKPCGKLKWRAQPKYRDGVPQGMRAGRYGSTYLYRTVTAPSAKTITGYFGSDDGMRAWLNGKLIVSRDVPRGYGPNQDKAQLKLLAGTNHLLLKIHNNTGGHGFYFHTDPKPVKGRGAPNPKRVARQALWDAVARDFRGQDSVPTEMERERLDAIWVEDWKAGDKVELARRYQRMTRVPPFAKETADLVAGVKTLADLDKVRVLYHQSRRVEEAGQLVQHFNFSALRLAIEDLAKSYPDDYPKGTEYLAQLDALEKRVVGIREATTNDKTDAVLKLAELADALNALRYEALLTENPLVDFDRLLLVKRNASYLGLPANWVTNASIKRTGYDNEIAILSPVSPKGALATLHRPKNGAFVGDVDLHWDAERMLFSSIGENGRWQVLEIRTDGSGLRQVTPGKEPDVDNFDACYLPNGNVIFSSTRAFHGVPCVGGGSPVANLCLLDVATGTERQLCFDQDQNWCPTVLNNGRVLYTRWEYSDTPHYFTRILFHMNPDGTEQMEYAFSNSYWPNSTFYARPVPDHPTKVVAIVSGHHGVRRMGELIVYDPAKGRHEADGAVQRIPGYGKPVPPKIADALVNRSWPRFLHPYPLSSHFFLVSCQMNSTSPWALYLVDVFDNMLPIMEIPGYALFEPVPVRETKMPQVIPSKVNMAKDHALIYLTDVYAGRGLEGVPRGTVKALRVYEFHFGYNGMGGHIHIGIDGPWDARRLHGTVPVYEDGSASFNVPANTPVAVQPLDAQGRALQVMRSWYTAMPGEVATCVGCHEPLNTTPKLRHTIASTRAPCEIKPWRGPVRGFSFRREVQPVLDKHCSGCHDGKPRADGKVLPNLADTSRGFRGFTKSYIALHPYVRRPGPESDYHLQKPLEWFADTSELVQMLKKGHHGVKLDAEAWDRIVTWIDLNVPDHGTWSEHRPNIDKIVQRRLAMRTAYANRPENPEAYATEAPERVPFVKPDPLPEREPVKLDVAGWPFDADEAKRRQDVPDTPADLTVDLGGGVSLAMVLVPAGEYVMGSADGYPDEYPPCPVRIEQPFYMGRFEITNAQYARFDPDHDSGYISVMNKDHSYRGRAVNGDRQPVVRASWEQAMAFCAWLSEKTGRDFSLPTEAQWEWACRAGTHTPFSFGGIDTGFGALANLADKRLNQLCIRDSPKWIPAIMSTDDGAIVTGQVGKYNRPNAWGLHDMHGNAAEWTRTTYKPYPYTNDGRDAGDKIGRKVARGGSYYDRPKRARSAFRQNYATWQCVHNVGFRVIAPVKSAKRIAAAR